MKKNLFFALVLISCVNLRAQQAAPANANFDLANYGVRVEPDRRLITVLASLEAANVETPLTATGAKFREKLRADLRDLNPDLRQKIRTFVEQYKRRRPNSSDAAIVAPFVSMAYSLSPAPDLLDPARTSDLPGDLLDVLDYAPLAREFYRRVTAAKIDEYARIYQTEADAGLRRSAAQMVGELLDYLHTKPQLSYVERVKTESPTGKNKKQTLQKTEIRERTRRFFIVPELLAPRGTINFLNIGDDYFAVVPPETDLSRSEVRRAYLQFALDPLIVNNVKEISAASEAIKKLLADLRQSSFERDKAANKNARIEDVPVSPDAFLAVSRSIVAATDARQYAFQKLQVATQRARLNKIQPKTETTDAQGRKVVKLTEELYLIDNKFVMPLINDEVVLRLSEDYEKGAVLAFYFADQLKGLENSGFDIASSFREMILSLDTVKEANRYAQFADARSRAAAARETSKLNNTDISKSGVLKSATVKLLEIDKIVQNKNYTVAKAELDRLLAANPNESPRIYYALGRVASLSAENIGDVESRNRRLLEAKVAYENVIRSVTNKIDSSDTESINVNSVNKDLAESAKALMSLSYVALGRIYEYDNEMEYAVKIYEAAIKIGIVPDGAYKEAVAARERLLKQLQ